MVMVMLHKHFYYASSEEKMRIKDFTSSRHYIWKIIVQSFYSTGLKSLKLKAILCILRTNFHDAKISLYNYKNNGFYNCKMSFLSAEYIFFEKFPCYYFVLNEHLLWSKQKLISEVLLYHAITYEARLSFYFCIFLSI